MVGGGEGEGEGEGDGRMLTDLGNYSCENRCNLIPTSLKNQHWNFTGTKQ
jgi:hypothetical protein